MKKNQNTIRHITIDSKHAMTSTLFGDETPMFLKYMKLIPGKPAKGEMKTLEFEDSEADGIRLRITRQPSGGAYFSIWKESVQAGPLVAGAIAITPADDIGAWLQLNDMGVSREADLHNTYPYLSIKVCPAYETVNLMQILQVAELELVTASVVLAKYRQESESGYYSGTEPTFTSSIELGDDEEAIVNNLESIMPPPDTQAVFTTLQVEAGRLKPLAVRINRTAEGRAVLSFAKPGHHWEPIALATIEVLNLTQPEGSDFLGNLCILTKHIRTSICPDGQAHIVRLRIGYPVRNRDQVVKEAANVFWFLALVACALAVKIELSIEAQ